MADESQVQNQNQQQQNPPEKPAKSGLLAVADDLYGAPKPPEQKPQNLQQAKPEGGEVPPKEPEEGAPPNDDGVEEVELSSLTQLADWAKQHDPDIDLNVDALMRLKVPTKVNGQAGEVSIADAVKSVQLGLATEQEFQNAKTKAQKIVAEAAQQKQQLEASVVVVGQMLADIESEINAEIQGTNWAKLKEDDPAVYAVKKEEIRERKEKLDERKRSTTQAYLLSIQQQEQKRQETFGQLVEAEKAKLVEAIPDMGDEEKSKGLKAKISEHLLSRGFSRDEISKAYDHRLILMAHEAMQFREAKQKAGAIKKKVIKIPKVIKPGTSQTAPKPNGAGKNDPVSILYP